MLNQLCDRKRVAIERCFDLRPIEKLNLLWRQLNVVVVNQVDEMLAERRRLHFRANVLEDPNSDSTRSSLSHIYERHCAEAN